MTIYTVHAPPDRRRSAGPDPARVRLRQGRLLLAGAVLPAALAALSAACGSCCSASCIVAAVARRAVRPAARRRRLPRLILSSRRLLFALSRPMTCAAGRSSGAAIALVGVAEGRRIARGGDPLLHRLRRSRRPADRRCRWPRRRRPSAPPADRPPAQTSSASSRRPGGAS